jgi:hypothetical protein
MKNVIAAAMTVAALTFSIALLARADVGSVSLFSVSGGVYTAQEIVSQ